jgi:hypothetical protein
VNRRDFLQTSLLGGAALGIEGLLARARWLMQQLMMRLETQKCSEHPVAGRLWRSSSNAST